MGLSLYSDSDLNSPLKDIDQAVATQRDSTKHTKIVGDSYTEFVYEFTNTEDVWQRDDQLFLNDIRIRYSDILNVRFLQDRTLNAGSNLSILHRCDYIALTVAKDEKPPEQGPADYQGDVYYLYLIGPPDLLERLTKAGAENKYRVRNNPSIPRTQLKRLFNNIRDGISPTSPEVYILQDYIERPAHLKIEGWQESGATRINADIDGDIESQGKSRGIQVGPYTSSKSKSQGAVVAELEGNIGDNSFSSEIKFIQISESGIFIDSDPVLNLDYGAIDRILKRDKGFSIEAHGTTYTIVGPEAADRLERTSFTALDRPDLEEAIQFIQEQVRQSTDDNGQGRKNEDKTADKMRELKNLHEEGILTDDEFESKKEDLLDKF